MLESFPTFYQRQTSQTPSPPKKLRTVRNQVITELYTNHSISANYIAGPGFQARLPSLSHEHYRWAHGDIVPLSSSPTLLPFFASFGHIKITELNPICIKYKPNPDKSNKVKQQKGKYDSLYWKSSLL